MSVDGAILPTRSRRCPEFATPDLRVQSLERMPENQVEWPMADPARQLLETAVGTEQ